MINICDDITAPTTCQPAYSCVLLLPPDSKSLRRVYFSGLANWTCSWPVEKCQCTCPVTPAPSSWLRDQSGSAQASPVQARRAKISLLGLLKLLWLTGWRCQSFTEHSTKAEASRFISRFKMTWSILRQHKEKPLSRSSTLPFGPSLYSWLCTPFAACCCWFCFAHCQCRPEALPPSSSHLCFFLLLPHLAAWPETRETWRLARRSPISIAMQSARMQPGNFSTVSL